MVENLKYAISLTFDQMACTALTQYAKSNTLNLPSHSLNKVQLYAVNSFKPFKYRLCIVCNSNNESVLHIQTCIWFEVELMQYLPMQQYSNQC